MITVTSDTFQEKISIVEKEIILNGPPSNLRGNIQFINQQKDLLRVKTLALVDKNKKRIKNAGKDFLRLSFRLNPGEQTIKSVTHIMPSTTPPGTYENYVMVGNEMHKVKMIVQPTININVHPTGFTFQNTAPGTRHTAVLTLTNLGNLPFQVPALKHAALLDMDMLCRAFGFSFREKVDEDLMDTLNRVTKSIKENMMDWVSVSVDEHGNIIEPGESITLHVHFVLPENADQKKDYSGSFRLWDKELSIVIKSHLENRKKISHGKQ